MARWNHRTTLPQSALRAASSLREGAGGLFPFNRVLAKIRGYGRFSSPLRNSEIFTFHHSTNDTPSVTPFGRASYLREGAGNGGTIQCTARKPQRCGRFSSPLRNSKTVSLYHSTDDTPSVTPIRACQLPQRGSRDGCTIQPAAQKPQHYGRFSSPLRKAFFYPSLNKNRPPDVFRRALQFSWRGSGCS